VRVHKLGAIARGSVINAPWINVDLTTRKHIDEDGAFSRGLDLALVTIAFLGLGYLLDRWLGTKPIFMIVLVVLALVAQFIKLRAAYELRMKELEAERAALRRGGERT
jgi:F0F1-type ATP synthase assembly protein I